jgi:hypothetical protein
VCGCVCAWGGGGNEQGARGEMFWGEHDGSHMSLLFMAQPHHPVL